MRMWIFAGILFSSAASAAIAAALDTGLAAYVRNDYSAALHEFQPLAKQGAIATRYNLEGSYYMGEGVAQSFVQMDITVDDPDAIAHIHKIHKAAEQGDAAAQHTLGVLYGLGVFEAVDGTEGVAWFRMAAKQGYALAQYDLGNMYSSGMGVTEDDTEAVTWFRMAAEQGYVPAQYRLGHMYRYGEGVPQDYVLAYAWLDLAIAQRYILRPGRADVVVFARFQAMEMRDTLRELMTRNQITEAQELCRELENQINQR